MAGIDAGRLRHRITFERKVPGSTFTSAGKEAWEVVASNIPAEVLDIRPARGEKLSDGLVTSTRQSRVTLRWRGDITPDMRIVYGARVMEIIGGPAELGSRDGLEVLAADYSTGFVA